MSLYWIVIISWNYSAADLGRKPNFSVWSLIQVCNSESKFVNMELSITSSLIQKKINQGIFFWLTCNFRSLFPLVCSSASVSCFYQTYVANYAQYKDTLSHLKYYRIHMVWPAGMFFRYLEHVFQNYFIKII